MAFKIKKLELEGKTVSRKKYDRQIAKMELALILAQRKVIEHRARVIVCFEGCDAAGKGGAIKRLMMNFDPRGFMVHPIGAPTDLEQSHHYLWRFWQCLPAREKIAIFDRTWYGRVLVERVEGFASKEEVRRAYREIREFERWLTDDGYLLIKFWLQIGKNEQLQRFKERQDSEYKRWKITEEDWRNRAKWDKYQKAVDIMIRETSTPHAPWTVVEANDKHFARLKVIDTVLKTIGKRLQ
ncbi:MAG: polyphosphate kinase 2 family protein [Planctomycetota bacterium]